MPKYLITGVKLGNANTWSALQTFSSGIVSPSVIGGTGTTSTLTLQPTSGVGASGADIIFKVGNNGATEAMRILNNGNVGIGTAGPIEKFRVATSQSANFASVIQNTHATGWGEKVIAGSTDSEYAFYVNDYNENNNLFNVRGTGNVYMKGNVGIGTAGPASLLDLRAGDLTFSGANGQKYVQGRLTELVAVGSGLTTKATTIQIPADAIVYAVPVRVNTQPGGTTTMTVTATTSGTAFQKGANISTAAGTTDPGTKNTPVNYNAVAAQTITFTFNAATTDALGVIRVDLYYSTATPPTS